MRLSRERLCHVLSDEPAPLSPGVFLQLCRVTSWLHFRVSSRRSQSRFCSCCCYSESCRPNPQAHVSTSWPPRPPPTRRARPHLDLRSQGPSSSHLGVCAALLDRLVYGSEGWKSRPFLLTAAVRLVYSHHGNPELQALGGASGGAWSEPTGWVQDIREVPPAPQDREPRSSIQNWSSNQRPGPLGSIGP